MKRFAFLLSLLAVAVPAFSRVISYAPYTDRTAFAGTHERTTRYFVLIERTGTGSLWDQSGQVVLYDSAGLEEPRVIYPTDGSAPVQFAALYETKTQPPWILIGASSKFLLSTDGGATWKEIAGITAVPGAARDVDVGGPFVGGLANQVILGTDSAPFVVALGQHAAVIRPSGDVHFLFGPPAYAVLVGRNVSGDKILVQHDGRILRVDLDTMQLTTLIVTDPQASYSGWITSDHSAYIQMLRPEGRFLFLHRNGALTFVRGPYDVTPPPSNSPAQYSADTMRFFAVPTHDFDGAWMIQRQSGKPTTFLRHTPSSGLETMWTDVTGPQVEALIAGQSGNTVLVQVHRERDVALDRPFVDPALAVWHVGDPAPRAYDELYLNESWDKGFVHVDVDELESGRPFVFNSGTEQSPIDIIVSPPPPSGGGGDVIQEWGVVRASLKQRLVLPGVARLRGAFDSYWLTDVTIYNPLEEKQDVEIRYVALGEAVQALEANAKTITLEPNEIRLISDALGTLFGIENGGGALHLLPSSAVNATSRTYSRTPAGGTFGFGMQAIDFFNAAGPRFPLTFSGAFPGEHFRTNILLTDASGHGSAAQMNAFGLTGPMGGSSFEFVPAGGITQSNGLGTPIGLLSHQAGGLIVKPILGMLIPTVVAIDNRTNDPTYFPPDIPANVPRMIPVIGHLDGANGSRFRSDLYLLNPTAEPRTITLEAKQWDGAMRKNVQFTLLPNEARVIPDVLTTMFGMSGLARLHFQSQQFGQGVRATSRTYTVEESGATYGCLIPPLNNFQIASPGDRLEILGVNAGGNFRVNLGLVELTRNATGEANVRIRILDGASKLVDTFTVSVPSSGGMQINDIFAARGLTPPAAAIIVVENLGGNPPGLIGAYATLTDNITNDSTFLGAQLGAQP